MPSLFLARAAALCLLVLVICAAPVTAQVDGRWDARFVEEDEDGFGFGGDTEAFAVHPLTGELYAAGRILRRTAPGSPGWHNLVRWTGEGWEGVTGDFNNAVNAIAFAPDGTLYAGGRFTEVDGTPVNYVARFDGATWQPMGQGVEARVWELTFDPATGDLYVGGDFEHVVQSDGSLVQSPKIARWTGAEWERVGYGSDGLTVLAIDFDPISGDLFVGGRLWGGMRNTDSTLVPIDDVARFDGTTWTPVEPDTRTLSIVNDIAFDSEGNLYVAHEADFGFHKWDREIWSVPAGGVGLFDEGRRRRDETRSLFVTEDKIYVGGAFDFVEQADGTLVRASGVAAYVPSEDRWYPLGEGVDRPNSHNVQAFALHDDGLFVGGTFTLAGARPSSHVGLWSEVGAPYPETRVTFRVDMRAPARKGLLGNVRSENPTSHRPLVQVLSGADADTYVLSDLDGDSVWTARIPQPANQAIEYVYGYDRSGNGYNDTFGGDWVFERPGPDGVRRVALTSAPEHTLPVVSFDNRELLDVDPDFEYRADQVFREGDPGRQNFPAGGTTASVTVDAEEMTPRTGMSVRWYAKDPGGEAPEGIAIVAENTYWAIAVAPRAAQFRAVVTFRYAPIPGIEEPLDLRLLHRDDSRDAWQIVEADVDVNEQVIRLTGATDLDGEWTLGSVSAANVLSLDPPGVASNPTPSDGALAAPIRPLLSWTPSSDARSFDVFFWEASEAEPGNPRRTVGEPEYQMPDDLVLGSTYNWRVVSKNINGETPGPVWSFTVGEVPDLTVTTVAVPDAAFSGQTVEVRWTVENAGDGGTNAPVWYDGVYVSDAPVLDPAEAVRVGRFKNIGFLNPGETYANTQRVLLPEGIEGTQYVHVFADDPERQRNRQTDRLDEADETNNSASAEVPVTLAPFADLQVTDLIVPSNVFSGDSVDVTYTVTNLGTGRTDTTHWTDSFFLSEDDFFDFIFTRATGVVRIDEARLGSTAHEGALEAGESYTATVRLKLPDEAIGEFTLFAYTDIVLRGGGPKGPERGLVYEFNVEINNWLGETFTSTLTPPPDLVVTRVLAPESATSGQEVLLQWTVENQGPGVTRSDLWYDWAYFSTTAEFDSATAVPIGSFRHDGALAPDESYDASNRVRVPDGVDGDGFYFVTTDGRMRVYEHTFEQNNRGGTTQAAAVTRAPYPDLQVTRVLAAPTQVTAGDQVAVTYDVLNAGNAPAGRAWIDSIFVSESPTWDPFAATSVFAVRQPAGLAAGDTRRRTAAVTLPTTVTGAVYVYVVPDVGDVQFEYPDTEGNAGRSAAISTAAYPPVDLAVRFDQAPETASSGQTVALELTVTNIGGARTVASEWFDELYLSTNDTLELDRDRTIAQFEREAGLDAGASYRYTGAFALPEDITGDVYLIAGVDEEQDVSEVDKANNLAVAPITITLTDPADLRVAEVTAPEAVLGGQPATVAWTVTNEGAGATRSKAQNEGWFDAVFLSPTSRLTRSAVLLGTREHTGNLASGASYTDTMRVTVPAFASGRYVFLVQTDRRDDVYEHNAEGDNVTTVQTQLTLPPPSDLVVSSITVPDEAVPGEPMTVTWTITNQGENPARGVMREAVFVSSDDAWDLRDPILGVSEREIDLAVGASVEAAMKVDVRQTYRINEAGEVTEVLPGVAPGSYRAVVRTDIANTIRETDNANNTSASEATFATDVPELVPGVAETVVLAGGQTQYYRLEAEADQDIRLTLTSDAPESGNELYVAFDRPPSAGGDFDAAAAEPFMSDQVLVLPSTDAGTYFVEVVARSVPGETETVTVLAEVLGFEITAVTPSVGGQGRVSTLLTGGGFRDDDRIFLRGDGGVESIMVTGEGTSTEIKVTQLLSTVPLGTYDVVVQRADGREEAVLEDGFVVEPATPPTLAVTEVIPEVFRAEGQAQFLYRYTNTGNIDIDYLDAYFQIADTPDLEVTTTAELKTMNDFFPPPDTVEAAPDYVVAPDGVYLVRLIGRDVPPGTEHRATFSTSTGSDGVYLFSHVARAVGSSEFVEELREELQDERAFILANPAAFSPETVSDAQDPEKWRDLNFGRFEEAGLVDEFRLTAAGAAPSAAETVMSTPDPVAATASAVPAVVVETASAASGFGGSADVVYEIEDSHYSEETPEEICARGAARAITKSCANKHKACDCVRDIHTRCFPFFEIERDEDFQNWCDDKFKACKKAMGDARRTDSSAPTTPDNCNCRPNIKSCDPNDILGPDGFGEENWVGVTQTLPYTIRFENDPELATAPAQVVRISHPLDPDVDARSFRLGDFGFGSFSFSPPGNVAHLRTRLDLSSELDLFVDVTAGIDILAREAFWVFTSVSPETGDQPRDDPFAGFLPVNDDTGSGEGFVRYTVRPNPEANTGDEIEARASIVFDLNAPIETPSLIHTIDADRPNSRALALPWKRDTTAFALEWNGSDVGAGLASYAVYVSEDDGPFEVYAEDLVEQQVLFAGEPNVQYRFFTRARDHAGNHEALKDGAEAGTLVPIEETEREVPDKFALHQNYPNPFNPSTTIPFDVPEVADVEVSIYNALGQRVLVVERAELAAGRYARQVNLSRLASGVYFYEIRVRGEGGLRFRDVKKLVLIK